MADIILQATPRPPQGTRPARRLRGEGKIPGVVYGLGADPVTLTVEWRELRAALITEQGMNAVINLEIGGDRTPTLVKDMQRHPVRRNVAAHRLHPRRPRQDRRRRGHHPPRGRGRGRHPRGRRGRPGPPVAAHHGQAGRHPVRPHRRHHRPRPSATPSGSATSRCPRASPPPSIPTTRWSPPATASPRPSSRPPRPRWPATPAKRPRPPRAKRAPRARAPRARPAPRVATPRAAPPRAATRADRFRDRGWPLRGRRRSQNGREHDVRTQAR